MYNKKLPNNFSNIPQEPYMYSSNCPSSKSIGHSKTKWHILVMTVRNSYDSHKKLWQLATFLTNIYDPRVSQEGGATIQRCPAEEHFPKTRYPEWAQWCWTDQEIPARQQWYFMSPTLWGMAYQVTPREKKHSPQRWRSSHYITLPVGKCNSAAAMTSTHHNPPSAEPSLRPLMPSQTLTPSLLELAPAATLLPTCQTGFFYSCN